MAGAEVVLWAAASGSCAALGTRRFAHDPRAGRLWWVAGIVGALGPVVAASSSTAPAAYGLPAGGLAAAAVVDAVEGRIPTPLSYTATVLSVVVLVGQAIATGDRGPLVRAAVLTALLVGALAVAWLAGGMGFGDVRLACGTATAMARGLPGLVVMAWVASVVAAGFVVGKRLRGGDARRVPYGPALISGWFFSIWTA